jgi:hypothetical protein
MGMFYFSEQHINLPRESCSRCVNLEFLTRKKYINSEKEEYEPMGYIYLL